MSIKYVDNTALGQGEDGREGGRSPLSHRVYLILGKIQMLNMFPLIQFLKMLPRNIWSKK